MVGITGTWRRGQEQPTDEHPPPAPGPGDRCASPDPSTPRAVGPHPPGAVGGWQLAERRVGPARILKVDRKMNSQTVLGVFSAPRLRPAIPAARSPPPCRPARRLPVLPALTCCIVGDLGHRPGRRGIVLHVDVPMYVMTPGTAPPASWRRSACSTSPPWSPSTKFDRRGRWMPCAAAGQAGQRNREAFGQTPEAMPSSAPSPAASMTAASPRSTRPSSPPPGLGPRRPVPACRASTPPQHHRANVLIPQAACAPGRISDTRAPLQPRGPWPPARPSRAKPSSCRPVPPCCWRPGPGARRHPPPPRARPPGNQRSAIYAADRSACWPMAGATNPRG